MITVVQARPVHTLARGRSAYYFKPMPDGWVEVRFISKRDRRRNGVFMLETAEARELWKWLLHTGYERW